MAQEKHDEFSFTELELLRLNTFKDKGYFLTSCVSLKMFLYHNGDARWQFALCF